MKEPPLTVIGKIPTSWVVFLGFSALLLTWLISTQMERKLYWKEEVELLSGEVISIQRTEWFDPTRGTGFGDVASGPGVPIKARIELEWNGKRVVWEEETTPMIVQLDRGEVIVVSTFYNGDAHRKYGCPQPNYLFQRYVDGSWLQVPYKDLRIPNQANLAMKPPSKSHLMTLSEKANIDYYMVDKSVLQIVTKPFFGC